ncbi:MAG: hypothetical protein AB7V58_11165 [Solirubrobacterales bacterium]
MNTTKLGVAMLAALAAMTIGASGAQAANFTAASYPAFLSAEPSSAGTPTLAFEGGTEAECEAFGFGGAITAATSSLALGPGATGCTDFGAAGTVETNGCEFVFHPGTGSADNYAGSFDVTCPAGEEIVVTGNGCEVRIGAQTGLGPVSYERLTTAPKEVQATFELESAAGFAYTKAVDGASCPLSGTGAKTDGVIGGGVSIKAGSIETLEQIDFGIE